MTFEQIEKEGKSYVNKFGITFRPVLDTGKWTVSYDTEDIINIELMEPIKELKRLLKNPDKVDVPMLIKFNSCYLCRGIE